MSVSNLLSDPNRWCKGSSAVDACNVDVDPEDERACKWCLSGAVCKAYPDDYYKRNEFLEVCTAVIIESWAPQFRGYIPFFNDSADITHDDVMRVVIETERRLQQKDSVCVPAS